MFCGWRCTTLAWRSSSFAGRPTKGFERTNPTGSSCCVQRKQRGLANPVCSPNSGAKSHREPGMQCQQVPNTDTSNTGISVKQEAWHEQSQSATANNGTVRLDSPTCSRLTITSSLKLIHTVGTPGPRRAGKCEAVYPTADFCSLRVCRRCSATWCTCVDPGREISVLHGEQRQMSVRSSCAPFSN